jgi:Mor family transcriptional regulator
MRTKTIERNREIFAGYVAGKTMVELAQTYGLVRQTITAIIGIERHRLEVSNDKFYEALRLSSGLRPWVKP